jgi:hypothetical protein
MLRSRLSRKRVATTRGAILLCNETHCCCGSSNLRNPLRLLVIGRACIQRHRAFASRICRAPRPSQWDSSGNCRLAEPRLVGAREFSAGPLSEFGWGDAAYYQAPDPSLGVTIAAVFWPTPTVMEVIAWQVVAEGVEDSETVALHVSEAELQAIAKSIDDSFVQPISRTGNSYPVARGRALFYHARGKFHTFRMCNRWTAERLHLAGCSVRPRLTMTASQAITAAKRCEAATPAPVLQPTH